MSIFKKKELTAEEVHALIRDVGNDIEKYGAEYVEKRFWREHNRNVWLGFFFCLAVLVSIILFFVIPPFPAAVIGATSISFLLGIISVI